MKMNMRPDEVKEYIKLVKKSKHKVDKIINRAADIWTNRDKDKEIKTMKEKQRMKTNGKK